MGKCMSCGGAAKKIMKKGGSIAAGIPYAAGAGQTDGKNGMMKLQEQILLLVQKEMQRKSNHGYCKEKN